jgi:copper chaperone CopZ
MIPRQIKSEHVVAAISEIKAVGTLPSRNPRRYFVAYKGKRYPPKYLVSLAAKHAIGRELRPSEFNGGKETNKVLSKLGFEVVGADVAPMHSHPGKSHTKIPATLHNEHCQKCKAAVTALLKKLYGEVEISKHFDIGTLPKNFSASTYSNALQTINAVLQQKRGFADFVRAPSLPPCDYFITTPGFILEFDESQHFTELRELALYHYPLSHSLAFDLARWRTLCGSISAHDTR